MGEMIEQNQAEDWRDLTGSLKYPMKNDYLVKVMLQRNPNVLKSLIASILRMDVGSITSAHIENPIEIGDEFHAKTFIMDIKVLVNDCAVVNIEMQVLREKQWPERSLGYLCRAFDNLNRGDDYADTKQALQICFLDFALFEDDPKFFSEYLLLDRKTHHLYTDKFRIYVVNLQKPDEAEKEEKRNGIDKWASLFAATTWEELKMLAQDNEMIGEAINTVYQVTLDPKERYRIEAREDTLIHERVVKRQLEELQSENAEVKAEYAEIKARYSELETGYSKLENEYMALKAELARLKGQSPDA